MEDMDNFSLCCKIRERSFVRLKIASKSI